MATKSILRPGPDHPITIELNPATVTVTAGGSEIARSDVALVLREASYGAVQYLPRSDANMALLSRSPHTSYCPYKGDCSYYHVVVDGRTIENAVWTYEAPFPDVTQIAGRLAFYPDRVTVDVSDPE